MTPEIVGVLGLLGPLVLLALRVPVGLSMIVVATLGQAALLNAHAALSRLGLDVFGIAANATLSVIPLFVLMGLVLSHARFGSDLYRFAARLLGNVRGALAMATIGASAVFASVSGSAVATTLTLAVVAVPEMRRLRYDDRLAAGAAACGGTLGILLPPSSVLVLYGLLTQESIGSVLVAGILPGILTTGLLMATAHLVARRHPTWAPPHDVTMEWQPPRALWIVPTVVGMSIGGLYLGVFTPTEAAAVGAFLALIGSLSADGSGCVDWAKRSRAPCGSRRRCF
jgi:tripartite ATP-independent transporter DctM subunit